MRAPALLARLTRTVGVIGEITRIFLAAARWVFLAGLRATLVASFLLALVLLFRVWMFRIRHTWLLLRVGQHRTALAMWILSPNSLLVCREGAHFECS
jgi:hypothetical protein